MKTKEELREAHGTPDEFERACVRASNDLFITDDEARAAVAKYRAEYEAAPTAQRSTEGDER